MDDSTILPLDVGPELHRELALYCEKNGLTMDQAVSQILSEKMAKELGSHERASVDIRTLSWQSLIPFARSIQKGTLFNVYDLAVRMHSRMNLSSLKLPGAWHSSFAMWVRRHSEFEIVRVADGNSFRRVSDDEAPVPEVKSPPRTLSSIRYTQRELQTQLRRMALDKPLNESFKFDDLYGAIPAEKRPSYLGFKAISQLKLWASDSRLFKVTTDPRSRSIVTFVRIADAVGEIT